MSTTVRNYVEKEGLFTQLTTEWLRFWTQTRVTGYGAFLSLLIKNQVQTGENKRATYWVRCRLASNYKPTRR